MTTCVNIWQKNILSNLRAWLLGESTTKVEVLKTELSLEPIRADSVTFLRTQKQILHLEFQVQVPTGKSMPLRMLNYWVRLHFPRNFRRGKTGRGVSNDYASTDTVVRYTRR